MIQTVGVKNLMFHFYNDLLFFFYFLLLLFFFSLKEIPKSV